MRSSLLSLVLVSAVMLLTAACVTETPSNPGFADRAPINSIRDAEARRRVAEIQFMHGNELLSNLTRLASLDDDAIPALEEGLESKDDHTRANVIWVLQSMGNRRHIPLVHPMLNDPAPGVRYQAGATLVELGDPAGFPILVDGLTDSQIAYRYKCFEVLREITGQNFGYRHDAAPEIRRAAVIRWLDWLDTIRTSAL